MLNIGIIQKFVNRVVCLFYEQVVEGACLNSVIHGQLIGLSKSPLVSSTSWIVWVAPTFSSNLILILEPVKRTVTTGHNIWLLITCRLTLVSLLAQDQLKQRALSNLYYSPDWYLLEIRDCWEWMLEMRAGSYPFSKEKTVPEYPA